MVSTYQFISGVVRHTLSETGQHQILPLFNLEQGAPVSQASAKTTGLLDICRRDFFFFFIWVYFPSSNRIPKQTGFM